jgi:hypothetical protein
MKDYLSRALRDWQDFDVTQHHLAVALGLVCDQSGDEIFLLPKHVLWSANRVSDFLTDVTKGLVQLGALEEDKEGSKFRWNPGYTMEAMVQRETGAS